MNLFRRVAALGAVVGSVGVLSSNSSEIGKVVREFETPVIESSMFSLDLLSILYLGEKTVRDKVTIKQALINWRASPLTRRSLWSRLTYSARSRLNERRDNTTVSAIDTSIDTQSDAVTAIHNIATIVSQHQNEFTEDLWLSARLRARDITGQPDKLNLGSGKSVKELHRSNYEPTVIARRVLSVYGTAALTVEPILRSPSAGRLLRKGVLRGGEDGVVNLCMAAMMLSRHEWWSADHAISVLEAYARVCEYERTFHLIKETQCRIYTMSRQRMLEVCK